MKRWIFTKTFGLQEIEFIQQEDSNSYRKKDDEVFYTLDFINRRYKAQTPEEAQVTFYKYAKKVIQEKISSAKKKIKEADAELKVLNDSLNVKDLIESHGDLFV